MARKPRAVAASKPSRRCKLTVCLDAETAHRLRVWAAFRGSDVSAVVAGWVASETGGLVCYERGAASAESAEASDLVGPPRPLRAVG